MTRCPVSVRRRGLLAAACTGALVVGGLAAIPIAGAAAQPDVEACTAQPADPQATAQAVNLLCYLHREYGSHILSGQQESLWNGGPDYEMDYLTENTGRLPAIRGMDLNDRPGSIDRAITWWDAGGIPMIGWHVGAPTKSDDCIGSQEAVSIDATDPRNGGARVVPGPA